MLAVLRVLQIKKGFAINWLRILFIGSPCTQNLGISNSVRWALTNLQHVLSRHLNDSKNRVATHNGHKKVLCYYNSENYSPRAYLTVSLSAVRSVKAAGICNNNLPVLPRKEGFSYLTLKQTGRADSQLLARYRPKRNRMFKVQLFRQYSGTKTSPRHDASDSLARIKMHNINCYYQHVEEKWNE